MNPLVLHLVLAFIVGGSWVTVVTIIAEKYGSTVGGLLGGLPSISVFSFFFIGWNQSAAVASSATTDFPLTLAISCIFVVAYAVLSKYGFGIGLLASFAFWLAGVSLIVATRFDSFYLSLLGYAIISLIVYWILSQKLHFETFSGKSSKYTPWQIAFRAALAGSIVALAVYSSQIAGPVFGAIFSAFPAVFTSTLYITSKTRGLEFSRSICKPLMISATITSAPYSVAVRFLFPVIGIVVGTLLSYVLVLPFVAASFYITKPRMARTHAAKNASLPGTSA